MCKRYIQFSLSFILIFLLGCSPALQNSVSPRFVTEPVPSNLQEGINIVNQDSIRIIIFPTTLLIDGFFNTEHSKLDDLNARLNLSPELVKQIDPKIIRQIYRADSVFLEHIMNDSTAYGEILTGHRRDQERTRRLSDNSKNMLLRDRQYLGYYNNAGERMALINFIDVSSSPRFYEFRTYFYKTFIPGCCDGPEAYVVHYNYNIDKDSLSVN